MLQNDLSRAHPVKQSDAGVCAAGHPLEADAGRRMLDEGGNAVDAAVAGAFMAAVVEQIDCGLGGFARVSVGMVGARPTFSIFDGYVRAPRAARADMFTAREDDAWTYYGHPPTVGDQARYGALAVAVPGAVAGLLRAHAACGRLPRAQVLAPAIEVAEAGVPFSWREKLVIADLQDEIRGLPDTAAVLLPRGRLPAVSMQTHETDKLDTRPLARTLARIAEEGERAFYDGEIAHTLAAYVQDHGGILSATDLENYRLGEARERPNTYRDLSYVTCQDEVAHLGLNILEGYDLPATGPDDALYRHTMAEALGVCFTDCLAHYGDPEFVQSPIAGLVSKEYAAARRAEMRPDGILPRPIAAGDPWPYHDAPFVEDGIRREMSAAARKGTSQVVAADRDGNMAAVCTSTGWNYGSLVYVPELGFFLNNGMSYFDPRPGRPASIAGGKMPIFGAPVVVAAKGDQPVLACAGSGGYRIETGVLHTLVNLVDHGMSVDRAIDHPRVHCQGGATFVDARIPEAVQDALREKGHEVAALVEDAGTLHFARVCCVARDPRTGALTASAAPSWLTGVSASR